jgi:dienelactone hydrolase
MARISRGTRETIKTILFIVAVLILVAIYIVYPLNRTKAFMGRLDMDDLPSDSIQLPNDITPFEEAGLNADSFRVESDGLTRLAAVYLSPKDSVPRGLAILIPDEHQGRRQVLPLARAWVDSGFAVVTYDQRASGASTGMYHSDGQYEAGDLQAMIADLEIHGKMAHPLIVVGYAAGADAALLTAIDEQRIDALAAVEPYLTTDRLIDAIRKTKSHYWYPFYRTMFWWWYDIRSSYAAEYREIEHLKAPTHKTLLLVPTEAQNDKAVQALVRQAPELILLRPVSMTEQELVGSLLDLTRK